MPSLPTVTRLWIRWWGVGKENGSLSASDSALLLRSSQAGFARRFVRNRLSVIGLVLIGLVLIMFFVLPFLVPFEPLKQDLGNSLSPPSWEHLFGADFQADVSRVIYGGQLSLLVG